MKRIHILLFLVCEVVMASCSSTTYTGEEDIQKPDVGYEQEPVPVTLAIGNTAYTAETRSSGAFGSLSDKDNSEADIIQWKNARFYVYAFAKGENVDLSTCWDDPKNVDEEICLIDATRPGKKEVTEKTRALADIRGKETYIEQDGYAYLYWNKMSDENDSPIYYNTVNREKPYNFFAYYVDDAVVGDFRREHDRIYFDVTINGQQDLMSSMAEPTKSQIEKLKAHPNKEKILENAFSAYSGNYDLAPVFVFKHHLTCLNFEIYPAGDLKDGADSEPYHLEICSIAVTNPVTKGVFTVATNDPEKHPLGIDFTSYNQDSNPTPIIVQKKYAKDGEIKFDTTTGDLSESVAFWEEDKKELEYYKRHGQALDGTVLLAPQSLYKAEITLRDLDGSLGGYEGETFEIEIMPPLGSETFEEGKCYTIRLGIFGRQRIESNVSISEWKPGGDIEFKPEG